MADRLITIEVSGLTEVRNWLLTRPMVTLRALGEAIAKSAYRIERGAKSALTTGYTRAIKSGYLRASTAVQSLSRLEASVYPLAKYAIFVHDGTRYMRPRPFMAVAVDEAKGDVQGYFDDAVKEITA